MRTVKQALIDEVHFPISEGFVDNKILSRGLDGDEEITQEILTSTAFVGATADCLYSLVDAPNFNEADKSFSLADREIILRKVNSLYSKIGEKPVALGEQPMVYFGSAICPS